MNTFRLFFALALLLGINCAIMADAKPKNSTSTCDYPTLSMPTGVITIPVVVHVIYNTAAQNISDAQIESQIQVLNEDYRRLNADTDNLWPQAADAEIEFELASNAPNSTYTCGITRTYTTVTSFPPGNDMKSSSTGGVDSWDTEQYLNIWVCNLDGIWGQSTFPGAANPTMHGVVIDYRAFGNIGDLEPDRDKGRTATHEIGHWLNLKNIWGDGDCTFDDFVSDTPVSDAGNTGCNIGHISCGSVDMVQNFMDDSDDGCKNLFTLGQKTRMRALFDLGGFRESLLTTFAFDNTLDTNLLIVTITFDDYPADISWTIVDSLTSTVVASGGNYPNATMANTTFVDSFYLADGGYTMNMMDSYGDGLCCNEGAGNYSLGTPYAMLYSSNGMFGSGESIGFNLTTQYHRFVGPGDNWDDAANWNKGVPAECHIGKIYIEHDCFKDGPLSAKSQAEIILQSGVTLEFN